MAEMIGSFLVRNENIRTVPAPKQSRESLYGPVDLVGMANQ